MSNENILWVKKFHKSGISDSTLILLGRNWIYLMMKQWLIRRTLEEANISLDTKHIVLLKDMSILRICSSRIITFELQEIHSICFALNFGYPKEELFLKYF